jgi:hypothetical protein
VNAVRLVQMCLTPDVGQKEWNERELVTRG